MQSSNENRVGDLIKAFFGQDGIKNRIMEHRAIAAWPQVVGAMIAKNTTEVRVSNRVLYIKIVSSAIRYELGYSRSQLRTAVNQQIGSTFIKKIIFY